jgi:predicted RNA-binding Zn-ribbon protein involved in translation (DUF1610 family)
MEGLTMANVNRAMLEVKMQEVVAMGGTAYVKWTCPACGLRVVCSQPNTIFFEGYKHEDCGYLYMGDEFGLLVTFGLKRVDV